MTSSVGEDRHLPLVGMRQVIARRMQQAWACPVFHITVAVTTNAADERRRLVDGASLTDELLRCVALSLTEHPMLNAHFIDDTVIVRTDINIGLAVALDEGLIVPVVRQVNDLTLHELAARRRDLVERARNASLTSADVAGGTFTVSNLGMYGVDRFDALLNPPQVAILAVGARQDRLELRESTVGVKGVVELTLTADHRAIDGAVAARFMQTLKAVLEREEGDASDG